MPESSIVGVYDPAERPSAGSQTVSAASIDSLGFHLAIIGLGVFIGYLIHSGMVRVEFLVRPPSADGRAFFDSFPLFPLCMIGGLVVQLFFANFTTRNPLDHRLMQRLSGTAMDFLVVAAISTINLEVVLGGLVPLAILVVAGVLWNVFCVMWLARRLLPADSWFERSIAEMGQSMASPPQGSCCCASSIPKATPMRPRPSATSSSCTSRSWAVGCGPAPPFRWRWPTIRWWYSASAPGQWRSGCWCGRCCFAVGSASGDRKAPLTLSRVASPAPRIIR